MSVALITGASSGIGAEFAQELAERKTDVVLVARNQRKLETLAQLFVEKYGIRAEAIAQDLSQPDAATKVVEALSAKNLQVDTLINNAGFGDYGAFADGDRAKQLQMIQLNVTALVDLTYQLLGPMLERQTGAIVNIGSIASFQSLPYMSVYAATKAFVLSFSEALWAELDGTGVRVLAACPGATKTDFFQVAGFSDLPGSAATPETVVKETLQALENSNKATVVVGGLGNQAIANVSRFFPRELLVKGVASQFRPKPKSE